MHRLALTGPGRPGRSLASPTPTSLRRARGQLARQVTELEEAQQARQAFLAKHPDVPHRLAELGRAVEHEQEVQRGQSHRRTLQREQVRPRISHGLDAGHGMDL